MKMSEIIERLIKMYGPDDVGTNELEIHELDILERRSFWVGRSWSFNQFHGSHDIDNDDEEVTYSVWISSFLNMQRADPQKYLKIYYRNLQEPYKPMDIKPIKD